MTNFDCVIVSIPFIEYYLPPAAPAVLKGHLESKGFKVQTYDFNITVRKKFKEDELPIASAYFLNNTTEKNFPNDILSKIDLLCEEWVDTILQKKPKFIAISVFTYDSRTACEILLDKLKTRDHDSKIVLGGMGVAESWLDTVRDKIDFYIMGEGELAFENLLQGNLDYKGINGRVDQIKDLTGLGPANYDDYDLTPYETFYQDRKVVQITGSRGCVRNCSFCDINNHWPSFTWRSSDSLVTEIQHTYETHGVRDFFFTDSLINGNLKVYMSMVEKLAEFNYKTGAKITWGGQYIVRKSQNLSKDYFSLTRDSGAYNLSLGVESGSNAVLAHMRKGVTREDLDDFIENFDTHNITCQYMLLFGYPTETEEDFEKTLDLFYEHQKYVASGTIHGATLNVTMGISEGMPIASAEPKVFTRDKSEDSSWGWTSTVVPKLDWEERLRRRLLAQEICDMLKWPTISADRELGGLMKTHENYLLWKKGITTTNINKRPLLSQLS
jgi:hypothetical protein